jgi:hypothetical protein
MRPLRATSYKSIPGKYYGTPKELWGFRSERGAGSRAAIAHQFLEANRTTLGITSALDRLDVARRRSCSGTRPAGCSIRPGACASTARGPAPS